MVLPNTNTYHELQQRTMQLSRNSALYKLESKKMLSMQKMSWIADVADRFVPHIWVYKDNDTT